MSAPKNIAIFLDGTWNTPASHTNVFKLYVDTSESPTQIKKYFKGVGTTWWETISGGIFAEGMTDIIRRVYDYLVQRYVPGDKVFLFGFSRGAFEVRALIGFLDICGLVHPDCPVSVDALWAYYEKVNVDLLAKSLEDLLNTPAADVPNLSPFEKAMRAHCKLISLTFVGVFDVVAADPNSTRHMYGQNLQSVERICHAMAIDEHRLPFQVMTFDDPPQRFAERDVRNVPDDCTDWRMEKKALHHIEQRWFVGAHSNVGGGFSETDVLCDVPRHWIQKCAIAQGLAFDRLVELDGTEHLRSPDQMTLDWRQWAMQAAWKHFRPLGASSSFNQTIDRTVFERYQDKAMGYEGAPKNLIEWAKDKKVDLSTIEPAHIWIDTGGIVNHDPNSVSRHIPRAKQENKK
ncbi:hypothetical protein ACHHYP_16942 [Achlya hypogyna]|uniref:T6SS Phospholipase effector Tle1-like catalytic domain-containing protein n=1 Tax=Achlya hypogyna TaxID=1202772 RepID=A0A1V9ZDT4_ACHHY|nr:hypothetical protein ACHHYP_16942 [Achlya hypogyna]